MSAIRRTRAEHEAACQGVEQRNDKPAARKKSKARKAVTRPRADRTGVTRETVSGPALPKPDADRFLDAAAERSARQIENRG
jgi:hypothetical protein